MDQTLVDTRVLKTLRTRRAWDQVYAGIPLCQVVPGAVTLIDAIRPIPVAIVTNSPSTYAKKVLAHFGIRHELLVAFHDVTNRKPHPEPIQLALQKLGLSATDVWSIGDQPEDIIASHAAGVTVTVAISAACDDAAALLAARPAVYVRDWLELSSEIVDEDRLRPQDM